MSERRHLQPNNATRYERALSEALDRSPELAPAIEALRGFKFNPTDALLPYMIEEYGLTEIADYLPDLRVALSEGILWQRSRGTPSAMHRALGWVGCDGEIEEMSPLRFKWWWFQVHLPDERRSTAFARPMTEVARATKPLRSELARVTAGFDKRAFLLNGSRLNGGALLNSWSGVRIHDGGPVFSLRVSHGERTDAETGIGLAGLKATFHWRRRRTNAAAGTEQRSSLSLSYSTQPADTTKNISFQNAPFVELPFEQPTPRVQVRY
ncbi:phage tail protein [Nitratireductor sp. B36]|uniref:phage tail protein n=1 Tax=Nitratireductor sp. B36 TaxID=2762059 RepID=UPI001E4BF2C0|nr:phage tail protein [Nitratireductor sp. B36]MCC5780750.1 phage tail protein [Nitratireductor sp. B36]